MFPIAAICHYNEKIDYSKVKNFFECELHFFSQSKHPTPSIEKTEYTILFAQLLEMAEWKESVSKLTMTLKV